MNRNGFHKQAMSNSLELSKKGIKIAQEAFRCKCSSQQALADKLSEVYQCTVTRQPIGRFLKGQTISRQIFVWICEELDIDVNKVVNPLSEPESETTTNIDYWHKICRKMLEDQKQNLRRQVTQMGFELNVFVPLGLVDRKHQPRRDGDFSLSPEQGSGFFQLDKEEIIKTYKHDEFLEQIIKQRQSKKSQGKRIAIIGEPGAGKTTLLEAIALSPKTPGFPIWISLGSLGEKSLEEYLCQKWLKDALKTSDVTQQQKELEELFKSGEVLLLLDGVDEMPASSPVKALAKIREELTGWVADARLVLTCRVNVWDASVNALQGFDTYRTLEFSYGDGNKPDQVREFICQWFSKAEKPKLGEPLRKKLDEDRHQRIRDLVKNPLRLSLLCQSWYFCQGDLPETKAALYEQFTRAFYDWKEEHFPTAPTKRKELNAALGLLAREAIDKEKSRFGIRESFALDVIGEELFSLTCKLHWLVHIYKDVDRCEKVYAFFHPTFQEYFAACGIEDWGYFLNHVPDNPKQGVYRIFERQWKEVILLWLGQPEEKVPNFQKRDFINALVGFGKPSRGFEDACIKFYWYQAFFLAAAGIAEFDGYNYADEIVIQLVQWSFFGNFKHFWNAYGSIAEEAKAALQETNPSKAIKSLIRIVRQLRQNWWWGEEHELLVAKCLGKIAPNNLGAVSSAIKLMIRLLHTSSLEEEDIEQRVAAVLGEIGAGNRDAINALLNLLQTSRDIGTLEAAVESLAKIGAGQVEVVKALKDLLQACLDIWVIGESDIKMAPIKLLQAKNNIWIFIKIANNLIKISPDLSEIFKATAQLLDFTKSEDERFILSTYLLKIHPSYQKAINVLIQLLKSQDAMTRLRSAQWLVGHQSSKQEAIKILSEVLEPSYDDKTRIKAAIILVNVIPYKQKAINVLIDLLKASDVQTRLLAANSLGKINPNNLASINTLINSLHTAHAQDWDWYIYSQSAFFLKNIVQESTYPIVVAGLKNCLWLDVSQDDHVELGRQNYCFEVLWHCAKNMTYPKFCEAWRNQQSSLHSANL